MVNYRPSKPNSPNGTGQVGYALVDFIELYDLGTLTPTPTGTATPPEVCHFHDPLDCDAWNWATSPTPTAVPTTLRALGSSSNLTTAPILTPTNTQGPTPTGVPYFDVACVDCEPDSGCLNVIHYGASESSPSIAMWREYPGDVFYCSNQYRVDICLTAASSCR